MHPSGKSVIAPQHYKHIIPRKQCSSGLYFWFKVEQSLLFRFRSKYQNHPLSFETRHLLYFRQIFEIGRKAQQKDLSLIFEHDLTAPEKDISFYFGSLFQKVLGMLQFEIVVMIIGIGSETDLLNHHFRDFCLDLLRLFLLLIEEFRIIDNPTDGGIGFRGDLHQIQTQLFGLIERFAQRYDHRLFDIFAHKSDLRGRYEIVDSMRSLFFLHTSWPYCCYRLRFRFCNYSFVLLTISETNIFAILFYLIF